MVRKLEEKVEQYVEKMLLKEWPYHRLRSLASNTTEDVQNKLGIKQKMMSNSTYKTFTEDYFETTYYIDQEQGRQFWVALVLSSLSTCLSLYNDRLLIFIFKL